MSSSQEIIYKEEVVENPKLADEFNLIVYTTMLVVFLLFLILGIFFLIAYLFIFGLLAFFISILIGAIFNFTKTSLPIQEEMYLFITFLFLLTFLMLFGFIFKSWDLLMGGLLDLTVVIFLYIVGFRPYMNYRKSVRNPVIVGRNEIIIGNLFRAKKGDIVKSVYNVSNGFLYIYTKQGKKFKISKDPSKLYHLYYSLPVNFDYMEYGKVLKKIGVTFFVVRRKGLFRKEIIKGRKVYDEIKHKERYERWIRKKSSKRL